MGGLFTKNFLSVRAEYKPEVIKAMQKAKHISKDPDTKRYSSFSEALEELDL